MRKIIYTQSDGNVAVVTPVGDITISDAAAEQRAWDKLPAGAIAPRWVASDAAPEDRTFRNAWGVDGTDVYVDMPKAREIQKDRLRALRTPLLAAADVEFMRALETGDAAELARIVLKKQLLRDVTDDPAIEAAATPEELKAVIPDAVKDQK